MNLADNLKRIRKESNLSQEQFAEKLGVSRQAVSKWESGQSYPEMDKVIQICNLFNLNMDELINEDLKEVKEAKEEKGLSNKYITSFFDYITKVVDMFSSMKFKQIVGCLFEQFIIGSILFIIIAIIGCVGASVVPDILGNILPDAIYRFIISILQAVFFIVGFVVGVSVLLHIFKIRYLDYYDFVKVDNKPKNKVIEQVVEQNILEDENKIENNENKIVLEKKKEKVVIRDPQHSEFKFLSGLGKAIIFIVKFFVAWILLFFAFCFIALVTFLAAGFLFVKTGILFIGYIIAMLGCIVICAIAIELMYNFIFNRKNRKTRIFIVGIIALICIGFGTGLSFIGISKFDVVEQSVDLVNDEYLLPMKDNLMVARLYDYYNIVEYVEEEREDVKIVVQHSKYFTSSFEEEGGYIYIHEYVPDGEIMQLLRLFIKDFNNKKITTYNSENKIIVYASKENIETMKNNRKQYFNDIDRILDELEQSKKEEDRLEIEVDRLESVLENNGYVVERDSNDRIVDIYKDLDYSE